VLGKEAKLPDPEEVGRAREAERGVWAEDRTTEGFAVEGLGSITEYLEAGGSVAGFKGWLEVREKRVLVVSTTNFTHFENVVEVFLSREAQLSDLSSLGGWVNKCFAAVPVSTMCHHWSVGTLRAGRSSWRLRALSGGVQ
jgi:hypothetical protein